MLSEEILAASYRKYAERSDFQIDEIYGLIASLIIEETPLQTNLVNLLPHYHVSSLLRYEPHILDLPVYLPVLDTFVHSWIVASHGTGKTTLLENLIHYRLQKPCCVVVMDSQGKHELLGRIAFPSVTLDTSTPLNMFARVRRPKDAREAEILETNQTDLITYVFSTTLGDGGDFTPKQRTLFTYLVQLVMALEGTVDDMLKLLLPKGLEAYRSVIPKLSPPAQLFFTTQFDDPKQYAESKQQIHWRLDSIMNRPAFARMFTQKKTVDIYSLLQKPGLTLVDTDIALLGKQGTELFGRFIIAQLLLASQQRLNTTYRLPTYVFIDEASDYIKNDENISDIIDKSRKAKLDFTFAHQREGQIENPRVRDALRHCGTIITRGGDHQFVYNSQYVFASPPVKRDIPKELKLLTYEPVRQLTYRE
jgi:hypothetical protein